MNTITLRVLSVMLKDMEFWQPLREGTHVTGYKLKLDHVYHELRTAREILFYDEVLFPRTQRAMRLIKKMNIIPGEWDEFEVGMNKQFLIWYPIDTGCQEYLSYRFEPYFASLYDDERTWGYEEPTEQELLALNVRPDALGAVQERLL